MAYQPIGTGSSPNDSTGDLLRNGFDKINDNFLELYRVALTQVVEISSADSPYTTLPSNYGHTILANASSGNITINLESAVQIGISLIIFKKIDSSTNTVSIVPFGSENIDGNNTAETLELTNQILILYCNGSEFFKFSIRPDGAVALDGVNGLVNSIHDNHPYVFNSDIAPVIVNDSSKYLTGVFNSGYGSNGASTNIKTKNSLLNFLNGNKPVRDIPLYLHMKESLNGYIHYFPYTSSAMPSRYLDDDLVFLDFEDYGSLSNTQLVDLGNQNRSWTFNGNATRSNAQSKFGSKSIYFDGTGDLLEANGLNSPKNKFTIDFWFYLSNTSGNQTIFSITSPSNFYGIVFQVNATTLATYISSNGTSHNLANGATVKTGMNALQWYHFRMAYDGKVYRVWLDGVLEYELLNTTQITSNATSVHLAGYYNNSTNPFEGYIDNFKYWNGVCLNPNPIDFDVPTESLDWTKRLWYNTAEQIMYEGWDYNWTASSGIYLGSGKYTQDIPIASGNTLANALNNNESNISFDFEGTVGDTTIIEPIHGDTWTSNNVEISNDNPKFGNTSLKNTANSNAYIRKDNMPPMKSRFTIEGWIYPTTDPSSGGSPYNISDTSTYHGTGMLTLYYDHLSTSGRLFIRINSTSNDYSLGSSNFALNEWHHIRVTYDGQHYRLFTDGIFRYKKASTTLLTTTRHTIGSLNGLSNAYSLTNHDSCKVMNGYCLNDTDDDFTAPTSHQEGVKWHWLDTSNDEAKEGAPGSTDDIPTLTTSDSTNNYKITQDFVGRNSTAKNISNIILENGNSYGSTATTVTRYDSITRLTAENESMGVIQSSVNGDSIEIRDRGLYTVSVAEDLSSSSDVTISIEDIDGNVLQSFTRNIIDTIFTKSFNLNGGEYIKIKIAGSTTRNSNSSKLNVIKVR